MFFYENNLAPAYYVVWRVESNMSTTTVKKSTSKIANALVDFSLTGAFPEEDVSSLKVGAEELPLAIEALAAAKVKLEVCHSPPVVLLIF